MSVEQWFLHISEQLSEMSVAIATLQAEQRAHLESHAVARASDDKRVARRMWLIGIVTGILTSMGVFAALGHALSGVGGR